MTIVFPIDFAAIRKALVDELQRCSGLTAILSEPEVQGAPRPPLPYFSLKVINPAIKVGDDSVQPLTGSTVVNHGGQREMVVSYKCYGRTHEEAFNHMARWQTWLDFSTTQTRLELTGIAHWRTDPMHDITMLLTTGYEGRAQMDVHFGIASNLTEDTGSIETINISGSVLDAAGTVLDTADVTFTAPN